MSVQILDRQVGPTGYGLLGLTWRPAIPSEEQAFAAMRTALEAGCNYWNAAEFYGTPEFNSMTLLQKYYARYPEDAERVVLNVKGAIFPPGLTPDGSPAGVRKSVENSLRMLGDRGKIDIFECGRRDPKVPLETTMNALDDLVKEGKIGGVGLSEVSANTIRQAAKYIKIVTVEVELSLWCTDPLSNGISDACYELGIPMTAYSPLGKGILSGQIQSYDDFAPTDIRRMLPRFQPANFANNLRLVSEISTIAQKKECTSAQIALSWLRNLYKVRKGIPVIVPIPGATKDAIIRENATHIDLTAEEMGEIEEVLAKCEIKGDRYHAAGMASING